MDQTEIDIHEVFKSIHFYQTHSNPLIRGLAVFFEKPTIKFDQLTQQLLDLGCATLKLGIGLVGHITEDNYLVINTNTYKDQRITKGMVLNLNHTLSKQVAYIYETLYSNNVDTDPAFHTNPVQYKGHIKKFISVPLFQNHLFFGTLSFSDSNPQSKDFTEDELAFTEEIANIISQTISSKNFPIIQTPPPFSIEERFLFDSMFNKSLIGMCKVNLEGQLLELNYSMTQLLGYKPEELCMRTWQVFSDVEHEPKDHKNAMALLSGEIDSYQTSKKLFHKDGSPLHCLVTVTLIRNQAGEPCFYISYIQDISELENIRLELVKRQEELEILNTQLQQQVRIDQLTQIYNRGYAIETLEKELKRGTRSNLPVSVILIDVDYFKQYNDEFGHLSGDEALIHIAQTLKTNCRDTDTIARFGGEEFLIVLPETPIKSAMQVAENLRHKIESISTLKRKVTISQGVSACEQYNDKMLIITENLLNLADQALYNAKNQGRNKVCQKTFEFSQIKEA